VYFLYECDTEMLVEIFQPRFQSADTTLEQ